MRNFLKIALGIAMTVSVAQVVSAQIVLTADLGNIVLQPGQADQTRDIVVQNTGSTPLVGIEGLNFVMQIGDGSAGPKIHAVSLSAGDSIFSGKVGSEGDTGSTAWTAFYTLDASSPVALNAGPPSTLLARVTFDTTGIASGSWNASLKNVLVASTPYSTEYVLSGGSTHPLDTVVNGQITVVPEVRWSTLVSAVGLVLLAAARRLRQAHPQS